MAKPLTFERARVPRIRAIGWERLRAPFAEDGREFMAHEIANYLGSARRDARALMFALAGDGLADLFLLIFHVCNLDTFVAERPLAEGLPVLPWECPECGDEVTDAKELRYDLLCVLRGPIQFR